MATSMHTQKLFMSVALVLSANAFASCPGMMLKEDDLRKMPAKAEYDLYLSHIKRTRYTTKDLPQDPRFLSWGYNLARDLFGLTNAENREGMFEAQNLKPCRRKATHRLSGIIAPVKLDTSVADDHLFTGFFANGAEFALMRLSSAPGIKVAPLTPSLSIRLTRDYANNGHPSDGQALNLSAISRLEDEADNSNGFFTSPFTNNLKPPVGVLARIVPGFHLTADKLNAKNGIAANDPRKLTGVYLPQTAFASTNTAGDIVGEPFAPIFIEFRPTAKYATMKGQWLNDDFRLTILENAKAGDIMFEVYAGNKADEMMRVFDVVLTDEFIASQFGNETLSFYHNDGKL